MPQILVVSDPTDDDTEPSVVYRERVAPSLFQSEHFSAQLAERLGWAVSDAEEPAAE